MLWGAEKLVPAEYWCPYGTNISWLMFVIRIQIQGIMMVRFLAYQFCKSCRNKTNTNNTKHFSRFRHRSTEIRPNKTSVRFQPKFSRSGAHLEAAGSVDDAGPTVDAWRGSPGAREMRNRCRMWVNARNSSMRASCSPKHTLRPVVKYTSCRRRFAPRHLGSVFCALFGNGAV